MERQFVSHSFQEEETCHAMPCGREAHEEAPGLVRRQGERGANMGKHLYCGFLGKEKVRQGKTGKA